MAENPVDSTELGKCTVMLTLDTSQFESELIKALQKLREFVEEAKQVISELPLNHVKANTPEKPEPPPNRETLEGSVPRTAEPCEDQ